MSGENGKLFAGLGGMVVLGLALGVWPNLRAADELTEKATDLASRVERSDDGEAALRRLNELLATRTQQAENTLKNIPRDGDVGGFIRAVSDKFGSLGLGRPEIKTGRPIDGDAAQALPMIVEVEGGFLQLVSAIEWVESIDRLVRVRKVTIESPTSRSNEPVFGDPLEGELALDVYYAPTHDSPLADAGEDGR